MEEKVTLNKAKKFLIEDDGSLEQQLMLCSLFLIAWEMLKEALRGHLEGFFADGHSFENDEIKHIISKEHQHLFTGKKVLENQLEVWKDFGAINDDEAELILSIKGTRNEIAHRFANFLLDDDWPHIEIEWIIGIRNILHKIDNWWLRNIEMDINPMLLDIKIEDVDFDNAYSLRVGFLSTMIETVQKKS